MSTHELAAALVGWIGGGIVNYLADVLPTVRRLSRPICPDCRETRRWQDVILPQACRSCGRGRWLRAWLVNLFLAGFSLYLWTSPPASLGFWPSWIALLYFATVFVIDFEHRLILHSTSLFGFGLALWIGNLRQGWTATLLGGLAGFGIVIMLYLLGMVFTRLRARRLQAANLEPDDEEAFGAGDVILATILGLMLGWPLAWFGLLFGILLGGVVSAVLLVILWLSGRFHPWATFIPFGPFFLTSAFLILYAPQLVRFLVPK